MHTVCFNVGKLKFSKPTDAAAKDLYAQCPPTSNYIVSSHNAVANQAFIKGIFIEMAPSGPMAPLWKKQKHWAIVNCNSCSHITKEHGCSKAEEIKIKC